jgi:hypothetical protein
MTLHMLTKQMLIASLSVVLLRIPLGANPLVYVISAGITGNGQFGTVDLTTGAYHQIGPIEPDGYFGLASGSNGSLFSLTYDANLVSINAASGAPTQIGATGLGPCLTPSPSCGPTSGFSLGGFGGKIYATDFANSIFDVNTANGAASLLARNSGIPASPFVLGSQNANGTLNFGDEAIWQSGGKLYATYDAWVFNPTSFTVVRVAVAPKLYQIDPTTGIAAVIGPTTLGIGAVVDVNGTDYAFDDITNQILALDLANGSTSVVGTFDPSTGVIQGAAPVPEPSSLILLGAALLGFQICRRRELQPLKAGAHSTFLLNPKSE